ncbi:uncharacterized protein LOC120905171 [Anopheles arabiensis]|nr:uncharacterized protein LOC120905171 [Anopheles arabiensis]
MGNGTKATQQRQPEEDRADLASTVEEEEREQLTAPSNLHYIQPSFISLISEKQWKPDVERQQDVPVYGRTTMATTILTQEAHTNGARMQLIMSILANLTVLSSGMGLGYSAITLHALTSEDNPMRMNSSQASWFASISSFACPLGGLVSGYLLDRIGRKKTLMLINVLSIVSWALIAVCSTTNFDLMYTQILIARVIIGIVIGLVSAPASIYSAEIATPKMRGRLTVLTSLSIAVGILLIYSMGYAVPDDFRLVAGLAAGICVLSLALLLFMPESPAWLMSKDREEEAERSLKKIRGYGAYSQRIPEVEKELMRMRDNVLAQRRAGQESFLRLLKQPQVYKPLGIIIGFFGFQQFSGIFVIVVYAAKVSSEASVSMDPFLCTVLIGITRVVATMLVAYILDTLGRKPPSIFSGVGMLVCMFGLALCSYFPPIESLNWIPTVLILTYIFTSTLGFLTMPFSMLAELFPQAVRGPASGVTVFFTYLMSFCTIKLYPTMVELLGSANVFLIYGAVSLLGVLYVIYIVPETKGKSLQEIEDYFRGMSHGSTPSQEVEEDEVSNLSSESLIELIRAGSVEDALHYAQTVRWECPGRTQQVASEIERTMALLLMVPQTRNTDSSSSFSTLLEQQHRDQVARTVNEALLLWDNRELPSARMEHLFKLILWAQAELERKMVQFSKLKNMAEATFESLYLADWNNRFIKKNTHTQTNPQCGRAHSITFALFAFGVSWCSVEFCSDVLKTRARAVCFLNRHKQTTGHHTHHTMSGKDTAEVEAALTGKQPQSPSKSPTHAVLTQLTRRAAIVQIVTAVVANITIISSGMGIGFPSIAMIELTNSTTSVVLTESDATWFASITSIMCPFGGLLSGYLLDKVGRKKTLYFINIISIVSWAIMSFASRTDSATLFIQLIVARIIIGIAIGLSSTPASVYAAEVAHPNLRGRLTLLTAFCTAIGMLSIYTLGYVFKNDWRFVCMICGIFTVVSLLTVIPLPESPSWLVSKKRMPKAERCLKVVRAIKEENHPEIRAELEALEDNIARFRSAQDGKKSKLDQLKKPEVYKPLAIMCTFFFFQQFTGIFVIIVYAASFSIEAGVAIDPFLSAVFVGLTRVVTTVLMSFISDKFGRRPPALFSGFGMATCMFGLAVCAIHPVKGTSLSWIPTVLLVAFIFTATLGFLTLPFSMNAEVYPTKIRGFASGLTIFFGYTMSFIILKIYPSLVETVGNSNVFILFGCLSMLGIAFVYFFLPETKGRTLEDIESHFRGKKHSSPDSKQEVEMKTMLKANEAA